MHSESAATTRAPVGARPRPWTVSIPAVIVALQGLVLVGLGAFLEWGAIIGEPESRSDAVLMGVICLVGGVGLLLCARALWRLRRWSRAPALVWQLLTIPIGLYQIQGDLWVVGVPLIVLAVIAMVLLAARRTTSALEDQDSPVTAADR